MQRNEHACDLMKLWSILVSHWPENKMLDLLARAMLDFIINSLVNIFCYQDVVTLTLILTVKPDTHSSKKLNTWKLQTDCILQQYVHTYAHTISS